MPRATAYAVYVMRQGARRTNKPQIPRSAYWRKKVCELAERLGWQESALWSYYDEFCLLSQYEMKMPRLTSEHAGYRLLRGCFDKQGAIPD